MDNRKTFSKLTKIIEHLHRIKKKHKEAENYQPVTTDNSFPNITRRTITRKKR